MQIKAKLPFCGQINMQAGQTAEVEKELAKRLIAAGYAEEITKSEPKPQGGANTQGKVKQTAKSRKRG